MATEESKRVMAIKKKYYDQIGFFVPKGGRQLLRVMGLKERCPASVVIRRAILKRAGLTRFPNPKRLANVETCSDAIAALIDCQAAEEEARKRRGGNAGE